MIERHTALKLIEGRPWHHEFEIIPGVRTKGTYNPEGLWNELQLPADLSGQSLADIGASNGYFSFVARKRGARVVAFDRRHKDNSGFGLIQYINEMSDIEHHQINIVQLAPEQFGQFDIVLALGLIYHVADPYLALANCAALCRKRLLIESYCIDSILPKEMRKEPIMMFHSDPKRFPARWHVHNDRSNFWGFTSACLQHMIEDIGFAVERVRVKGDRVLISSERSTSDQAPTRLKVAYGTVQTTPVNANPELPESWKIF